MNKIAQQKGSIDTAMIVTFSPIILAFIIGALPVLVPLLVVRGLSRLVGGGFHPAH